MTDLFGLEQQTPRTNNRLEAAALLEVMKALHTHPLVSWCERMNSGAVRVGGLQKVLRRVVHCARATDGEHPDFSHLLCLVFIGRASPRQGNWLG